MELFPSEKVKLSERQSRGKALFTVKAPQALEEDPH